MNRDKTVRGAALTLLAAGAAWIANLNSIPR